MATVKTLIGNVKGNPGKDGKDGSENQIYSTDEQVIGKWIDGKPVYRKVVTLSTAKYIDGTSPSISHGISNIDRTISCRALNTGNDTVDVYWHNTKNATSGSFYSSDGIDGVKILIFEYTKTTD